ncbi:hypothetical protein BY458DRAFT_497943 [Sporodiniella umbellata]|nr:hypothetical protein BY458DRAFT_497943 [Sporodiniella umbellata]
MSQTCPLQTLAELQYFQPQAEDILVDEDLLELFRIIKLIIRKKPDAEKVAKLYFCIVYALGDQYSFHKPAHEENIVFKDENIVARVQLPFSATCCYENSTVEERAESQRQLSVSYLTHPKTPIRLSQPESEANKDTSTDRFTVRPYTHIRPVPWSPEQELLSEGSSPRAEIIIEPKQRGFYYQDGRISREPPLLQRYAEQGVLTQASLMRKRKKQTPEYDYSNIQDLSLMATPKKPKIPHRHGEFAQRRDDIISRMRTIMIADLEQKAQRLPQNFSLSIEQTSLPDNLDAENLTTEESSHLMLPALNALTFHSNMKPHLENGMNQNGIYYNSDYFRLYLAFVQFQGIFARVFPNQIIKITSKSSLDDDPSSNSAEGDKDRERNANMKAYRSWIEPHLTESNWAAFRRNVMVGERMMQLTKSVGQGVLLMTKELSGSKLHLTFTNNEWDKFIQGLTQGEWDETIDWSHEDSERIEGVSNSLLINELRYKFATHFWFTEEGTLVSQTERKAARIRERRQKRVSESEGLP